MIIIPALIIINAILEWRVRQNFWLSDYDNKSSGDSEDNRDSEKNEDFKELWIIDINILLYDTWRIK